MLDFIGIGSRWAGEEWLYDQLRRHPEIHFPRDLEIGFWSTHYLRGQQEADYGRNLAWYRSIFGHWEETVGGTTLPSHAAQSVPPYRRTWFDRLMARLDSLGGVPTLPETTMAAQESWAKRANYRLGDFSPSYCWFDDPRILPAIAQFAPHARILYIIRNPIERAFAAVEKLREVAGLKPEEVSDAWYLDHIRAQQSLKQGNYARNLRAWQQHYPKEQILVLRYEAITCDPQALLSQCVEHLGVTDKNFYHDQPTASLLPHRAVSDVTIRPSLIVPLRELYRDKIVMLFDQYGIDYRDTLESKK